MLAAATLISAVAVIFLAEEAKKLIEAYRVRVAGRSGGNGRALQRAARPLRGSWLRPCDLFYLAVGQKRPCGLRGVTLR